MEGEKKRLFREFHKKALYLEHQNELVEAKKNYQLAITVNPSNKRARQGITQINEQLQSLAGKHYQRSIILQKKGRYSEATRYLLITLRFWPEHAKARQMLMSNQHLNIQKYTWHTIKRGETLSIISKTFYGNFNQSGIIAKVNNIKDASRIRIGMKLKIPELTSHPFINQTPAAIREHLTDTPIQVEEKVDTITMYKNMGIDFFNNQEFENAVIELKKVLSADPEDKDSIEYISKAYFNIGSKAYTKKNHITAIKNFQNALTFNKNCSLCEEKITQSRHSYKEYHYKAGMKYFDGQNLNLAIFEWDLVQKMDPGYKKVAELLSKAKTIQKNIEAIKQSE